MTIFAGRVAYGAGGAARRPPVTAAAADAHEAGE